MHATFSFYTSHASCLACSWYYHPAILGKHISTIIFQWGEGEKTTHREMSTMKDKWVTKMHMNRYRSWNCQKPQCRLECALQIYLSTSSAKCLHSSDPINRTFSGSRDFIKRPWVNPVVLCKRQRLKSDSAFYTHNKRHPLCSWSR
jgi:hypothetical protein